MYVGFFIGRSCCWTPMFEWYWITSLHWLSQLMCVTLFIVMQCYNSILRMWNFTKRSCLCFVLAERPIEFLLLKFDLLSKTLLICVIPNSKHTLIGIISVVMNGHWKEKLLWWEWTTCLKFKHHLDTRFTTLHWVISEVTLIYMKI